MHLTDDGEGLTFSYGPLPPTPDDAPRVRLGLRVELRTHHNDTRARELIVTYDDVALVHVAVPSPRQRRGAFVPLRIAYDRASHGGSVPGLTAIFGGASLVRGMRIHTWLPQSAWRFRLSAKSGRSHADAVIRRLRIRTGGMSEAQETPLHITRNDQDFDMSPAPHSGMYVFYGPPVISSIAPASGPTDGGSRLLLAGESLLGGSAYHCRFGHVDRSPGGVYPPSHERIIFPDLNTSHSAPFLHCTTPPYGSPSTIAPQVSLNRQDETDSHVPFRYYDPPALFAISPTSGPSLGATLLKLYGANFSSAMHAEGNATNTTDAADLTAPLVVCRFGPPMWPRHHGHLSVLTPRDAVAGPARVGQRAVHGLAPNEVFASVVNDSLVVCVSPPSVGGNHDAVHVEVSLNGHDFTRGMPMYHFYAEAPRISSVFPRTDSSAGGRLLTIRGTGLSNGSDVLCQFRSSHTLEGVGRMELGVAGLTFTTQFIPASVPDDDTVVCISPTLPPHSPLASAEVPVVFPLELRVSLNAQQYTAAPSGHALDPPLAFGISAGGSGDTTPVLLDVLPALGPVNGSTFVRVSGLVLGHGSLYLCKFGTAVVNASFDGIEGAVRCHTPPHAPSTVALAISFNGQHYESTTFQFTFHEELELHEVSPSSGPAYSVQCADDMRCPGGTHLGTLVTITGVHLAGGAPPLFPTSSALDLYRCRFDETVVPATLISIQAVDHILRCHAPGSLAAGTVAVLTVSLNAHDYSMAALAFTYQQPELTITMDPALGPALGGTNITFVGDGLGSGSHYLCRFGTLVVPAVSATNRTANGAAITSPLSATSVHCTTPRWSALPAAALAHRLDQHRAPVALSLNGQQYYRTGLYFAYHPTPTLSHVTPPAGPASGGTAVRIDGSSLDGGDKSLFEELWVSQLEDVRTRAELACRFDALNGSLPIAMVPATWQAAHERVLCKTPSAQPTIASTSLDATLPFDATISLSLNGVDFAASHVTFTYMPPPVLASISPFSGPSLGGTDITMRGTGFSPRLGIACAVEDAIIQATIDSSTSIRCTTPSIGHASPTGHRGVLYPLGSLPLRGNATRLHSAIRLSATDDASAGSMMIPIPQGTPELLDFDTSWLYMLPAEANLYTTAAGSARFDHPTAASAQDARIAFRYGPIPDGVFGGEGAVDGLSVSLSDGPPPLVVEVRYGGTTILSRAVGAPLPRGTWMRVRIRCDAANLTVSADDRTLVGGLIIPGWTPTRAWHMGLGASGRRPARYVAEVHLRSALILGLSDSPVRLSMHGAQYTDTFMNFTYTSVAVVSDISPASGPSSSPTQIVITGANFNLGLGVACRLDQFGNTSTRPATLDVNGTNAAINCTVPMEPWVAGGINIYVSLDNGAYGPGALFERYATPTLRRLWPILGVGASTRVRIYGDGLLSGTDRRCRFDGREVPAYLPSAGGDHLVCTAPVNTMAGEVDVEVTLNGAQYVSTGSTLRFNYLTAGMVFVSSVAPPLGPLLGSPNISVYGTNFVRLPDGLACAFGGKTTNATFITSSHLLCEAPRAATEGEVNVEVSLNLQEFYSGAPFYYSTDGSLGRPTPSSKGRSGGGTALIDLSPPLSDTTIAIGSFLCRFGQAPCDGGGGGSDPTCVVSAATRVSPSLMRCVVPHSPLAHNPAVASTDVSIWISLNGHQFSYGVAPFTFFEVDPEIHAIEPPIGPILGATDVFVRGVGLHAGLAGEHGCRFSLPNEVGEFVAATPAADQTGLRCASPSKALALESSVEITLNLADWVANTSVALFTYTLHGAPSIVTPESGPRHGGTTLLFSTRPRPQAHRDLTNGLALCRLGNATVSGTFTADGFLRCIAPAGPVQRVDVGVALNGQQFEYGRASYSFAYSLSDLMGETDPSDPSSVSAVADSPPPPASPPPNATAILEGMSDASGGGGGGGGGGASGPSPPRALVAFPVVGPTAGGTNVSFTAQFSLAVATDLRCRFGPSSFTGSVVPATLAPGDNTVAHCISPAALSSLASTAAVYPYTHTVPLSLSLNGQQYVNIDSFRLYAPAVPSAFTPMEGSLNGPYDGGTMVNISGSLLGGGGGSVPRLCSFGSAIVTATHVDNSGDGSGAYLRCHAPSADATGVRQWSTIDFAEEAQLQGQASFHGDAGLSGGSLRLVGRSLSSWGGFMRRCGSMVLTPLTGARALPFFEVRFDILIAGATIVPGGSGASFNYGPITDGAALDERGSGHNGLGVSFRGGVSNVIEVRLDGRLVLAAPLAHALRGQVWTPIVIRHTERTYNHAGGLQVRIGDALVLSGLQLVPGWLPQPSWRLALAACSTDALDTSHEHWVHHMRIGSGSMVNRTIIPIRVSLNGQQFDPTPDVGMPLSMSYLTVPVTSYVTPRHGGVSGGSTVQIFGLHFGYGSVTRCRFGEQGDVVATVAATSAAGAEIRCTSPPSNGAFVTGLRVSVNGEQFSSPPLPYVYHPDVAISSVAPASGPTDGGTSLRLVGSIPHLAPGLAHPMCRFVAGSVSVPFPATYESAVGGVLRCIAPPAAQLQLYHPFPQRAALRISLNGLDYSPLHAANFTYVPTYRGLSASPDTGPEMGGTNISIVGTNITSDEQYEELTCRIGVATIRATIAEASTLMCVSPTLQDAAGVHEHAATWQTLGVARAHGAGYLLTDQEAHTGGGIVMRATNPNLQPPRHPAPPSINLTFQILITSSNAGGRGDGTGFSVSYGDLDSGVLGEYGGGTGLRVSFRSGATPSDQSVPYRMPIPPTALSLNSDVISVSIGSMLLREYWLRADDPPLPASGPAGYVPIRVEYEPAHGLTVAVRGERLIQDLALPDWSPRADWSVGIGARCAATPAQFAVRAPTLRSGLFLTGGQLGLQVTLNGHDYDGGGMRFHYYGIFRAFPTLGPASGGTIVRLNGTALERGPPRTCRFGEIDVSASVLPGSTDLVCASPPVAEPGLYPSGLMLSVSLNGVDHHPVLNFTFYGQPMVSSIYPRSGSAVGGTPITVTGRGLLSASLRPLCRFGATVEVPASTDPATRGTLVCIAPPLPARTDAIVTVSLDGQYYTSDAVAYTPLEHLATVHVSPSSGPIGGGTHVSVKATGLRGASVLRCRFGNETVIATWDPAFYSEAEAEAAGALVCTVPPLTLDVDAATLASLGESLNASRIVYDAAGEPVPPPPWPGLPMQVPVEVSANGEDYGRATGDDVIAYTYIQPMPTYAIIAISPPTGPTEGGTRVAINGFMITGSSNPMCRFGGAPVNATVDGGASAERMHCATPPHAAPASPIAIELSANGQQWVGTNVPFTYAPPPIVDTILPDVAPNLGGLVLELSGRSLSGGSGYLCRFGAAGVANAPTVAATLDAASESVLCISPPSLLGYVPVRVSLNGQQFSARGPTLTFYDPDSLDSLLPGEGDTIAQVADEPVQ